MIKRLPLRLGRAGLSAQTRRCISYDKNSLTNDALQTQVEAGLDNGQNDDRIHVDNESKTISTAAGHLPISPLFDVDWMKARRRQRKDDVGKTMGRFRRKLASNPYAQALATPLRRCPRTATTIPRYFLQDFDLVRHPSDDTLWWAPGSLSFEGLRTKNISSPSSSATSTDSPQRNKSPVTAYVLSQKSIIDQLGGKNKKNFAVLLSMRTGMAIGPSVKNAVWREDMGDFLLKMMRSHVTDALISMSTRGEDQTHQYLQSCKWEEVGHVEARGCVLWLPSKNESSTQLATINVDGAKYGQTITVHDLNWLLGEAEVKRLKSESIFFENHDIFVLRQKKNKSLMGLHLLLWRLQGYMASSSNS